MTTKEETSPHLKDHNGKTICFADTLTQAQNALNRKGLEKADDAPKLNDAHLMLFGVEQWDTAQVKKMNVALKQDLNTFKRLEIFGCEIPEASQVELAKGFKEGGLDNVEQFDLDNVTLQPKGALAIFKEVAEAPGIEVLNLQGSIPNVEVLKALSQGLGEKTNIYKTMKKMDLKINNIKQDGAEVLAEIIPRFLNVDECELDLFYNELAAEGAGNIARGLTQPTCVLSHLDMCCNNIGDEGARHIAKALATNRSLRVLKLALNNIGVDGAIAIFDSLVTTNSRREANQTLEILDLSANVMKEIIDKEKEKKVEDPNEAEIEKLDLRQKEIHEKLELDGDNDEEIQALQEELDDITEKIEKLRKASPNNVDHRPFTKKLISVLNDAHYLEEIDFTGIELDDVGWDRLSDCLQLSYNNPLRDEAGKEKMRIKFSIVDLMDFDRLKRMEEKIWGTDKNTRYGHIDWRRRDPEKKEDENKTDG